MEANKKNPFRLPEINQENPFRVPDNYFDNFYARLETKLVAETVNHKTEKEFRIYHYLKPALAIAASLVLVFLVLNWPMNSGRQNKLAKSGQYEAISIDDVYYNMVSNLDENSFLAVLNEPDTKEKLSDDDIANYVNTNFSDYELYIESINRLK